MAVITMATAHSKVTMAPTAITEITAHIIMAVTAVRASIIAIIIAAINFKRDLTESVNGHFASTPID